MCMVSCECRCVEVCDFLDMTLFIALLVCTSPIYLSTHDDVIELNAPSTCKHSNGNYKTPEISK